MVIINRITSCSIYKRKFSEVDKQRNKLVYKINMNTDDGIEIYVKYIGELSNYNKNIKNQHKKLPQLTKFNNRYTSYKPNDEMT